MLIASVTVTWPSTLPAASSAAPGGTTTLTLPFGPTMQLTPAMAGAWQSGTWPACAVTVAVMHEAPPAPVQTFTVSGSWVMYLDASMFSSIDTPSTHPISVHPW